MTRRDTPPQWLPLMEKQRLHSARDIAAALGISPATATRLLHGEQTSQETIEAVAELLQVTPEEIRRLRGEVVLPPFRLPQQADRLTARQREAVLAVVRAMLEPAADDAQRQTDALEADLSAKLNQAEVKVSPPPATLSDRRSRKGRPGRP